MFHAENQPPRLLKLGDSYKDDLKIIFGRWPQDIYNFLSIVLLVR